MATITNRGDLQWQVKVRRRGFPSQSRTIDTNLYFRTNLQFS